MDDIPIVITLADFTSREISCHSFQTQFTQTLDKKKKFPSTGIQTTPLHCLHLVVEGLYDPMAPTAMLMVA